MIDVEAVVAIVALIAGIAGWFVQFVIARMRETFKDALHERDTEIAEMRGQLAALKDTIESFARAFIDRRSHE